MADGTGVRPAGSGLAGRLARAGEGRGPGRRAEGVHQVGEVRDADGAVAGVVELGLEAGVPVAQPEDRTEQRIVGHTHHAVVAVVGVARVPVAVEIAIQLCRIRVGDAVVFRVADPVSVAVVGSRAGRGAAEGRDRRAGGVQGHENVGSGVARGEALVAAQRRGELLGVGAARAGARREPLAEDGELRRPRHSGREERARE